MPMSKQQVAGHLGMAKNPQVSQGAKHTSRQAVMKSGASKGSGASSQSQSRMAGKIGVTTNPSASKSVQHQARKDVMNAAGK